MDIIIKKPGLRCTAGFFIRWILSFRAYFISVFFINSESGESSFSCNFLSSTVSRAELSLARKLELDLSFVPIFRRKSFSISMLENATHLGLPVPTKLKDVLEQIHNRSEEKEDDES